jgi:hypothetical protein
MNNEEIPRNYQTIIEICKRQISSHIWFNELRAAIATCYAGGIGNLHYTEHLATLANIIKILAGETAAEEQEICEIALFLAGRRSEGQLAQALSVDRLEARARVQAFLNRVVADAQVPIEKI